MSNSFCRLHAELELLTSNRAPWLQLLQAVPWIHMSEDPVSKTRSKVWGGEPTLRWHKGFVSFSSDAASDRKCYVLKHLPDGAHELQIE